jgi:hypothetical protein
MNGRSPVIRQQMVVVRCRIRSCGSNALGTLFNIHNEGRPGNPVGLFVAARPMMHGWPLPEFEVPADYSGVVGMHVCRSHFMSRDPNGMLIVGSLASQVDRHLAKEVRRERERTDSDGPVTVSVQRQSWFDLECGDLRRHVEAYQTTRRTQSLLV